MPRTAASGQIETLISYLPLREALNRLQAERLVTAESLRGFRVAPLSLDELRDAVSLRIVIETEALKASISKGDDSWASDIVSALYTLNVQAAHRRRGRYLDARKAASCIPSRLAGRLQFALDAGILRTALCGDRALPHSGSARIGIAGGS